MSETITASELKSNIGKYLRLVQTTDEGVRITKNGKVIARLVPDNEEADISDLLALRGIIPDRGQTKQSIREERIRERYESID